MAEGTAADFVRKLPATFTLREMEAALKAEGLPALSYQRLYQIRKEEKLGFKRAPHSGGRPRTKKKKKKEPKKVARVTAREAIEAIAPKPQPPSIDAKEQLRRLAMRIGLIRLVELVHEIEHEAGM